MNTESQTRKEIIDKKLKAAGWDINNRSEVAQEFDIEVDLPSGVCEPRTPYEGHQFSDYVLMGKDAKPLAVVEAKKSAKDAEIGREQAKQYCYNIQKQYRSILPFCFYTNGLEIYFWDLGNYPPRKVIGFPTRDDLERFKYIREHKKRPTTESIKNESQFVTIPIKQIPGNAESIRIVRTEIDIPVGVASDLCMVLTTLLGDRSGARCLG